MNKMVKQYRLDITADSAGIMALNGSSAMENAIAAIEEEGINISEHRSKSLTRELLYSNDLIIALEAQHKEQIIKAYNIDEGKIKTLGNGISDPYGFSLNTYIDTKNEIKEALEALIEKL